MYVYGEDMFDVHRVNINGMSPHSGASLSSVFQAKQQRLIEHHADVNNTLITARGFVSEAERTVGEVDAMVQVRNPEAQKCVPGL